MSSLPVPQRWLLALLGAAFLLEVTLSAAAGVHHYEYALPGAAVLLACVYLAVYRPGLAALAGAATLLASSVLIKQTGTVPQWVGIQSLLLSEVLAGGALVVLVVWRCHPVAAVGATSVLVVACLATLLVRAGRLLDLRSLPFGFTLLVICATAGLYLRRSGVDSELRTLVRRQWPLAAVLTVLLLFDIGASGGGLVSLSFVSPQGPMQVFALTGAAIAAVCAFFAPRTPVSAALLGAAAIAAGTLPVLATELIASTAARLPVTLTQLAASMALIAFVTRHARPQPAGWSTAALSAANLVALQSHEWAYLREDYLLPLGFLLVVSVATGLYFRARDRERHQLVQAAVTGAQQSERMALARELHDVVAHHVTGIVVQAQAARMVAGRDPAVAVGALEKIESSGTEALAAMRMLVGSLRGAEPAGDSTAPAQATSDLAADLRALVEQFPGPTVHLELSLPDRLPHEVGRSVLRLVQESLTNVSKHAAGARTVRVDVSSTETELHVGVVDDGTARRSTPIGGSGGYGLIGMRERVELLGGRFFAGPGPDNGWTVEAWLPLRSNQP